MESDEGDSLRDEDQRVFRAIEGVFTPLGMAEMMAPDWVIEDLLPPGLSFLVAPPKTGKSTIAMVMATLIAGWDCRALPAYLSKVKRKGPVMVFSDEAGAGELRHMVEVGLKCETVADESIIVADDPYEFQLDSEAGSQNMMSWLEDRDPQAVIVDPFANFHQVPEKESGPMIHMIHPFRKWAKKHDSAFVLVHHTKKPGDKDGDRMLNENDIRGTSALFGMADSVIVATPVDGGATHFKANFKRAQGWEKDLMLATYEKAGTRPTETMIQSDLRVLEELSKKGDVEIETLCKLCHITKDRVVTSIAKLHRNGLITRQGRKWFPVKESKQ